MGQIIGGAAKPKRCNISKLSQLGTPAAGEHILVSSDNSMNAAGQGNFDRYIVGDGSTAATALEIKAISKIDTIEIERINSQQKEIVILDDNNGEIVTITDDGLVAKSLKVGTKSVLTTDDKYVAGTNISINGNVISADAQFPEEIIQTPDEEQIWSSDDAQTVFAKINSNGFYAKEYYYTNGDLLKDVVENELGFGEKDKVCNKNYNQSAIADFINKYVAKDVDEWNQLSIMMCGDSIFGRQASGTGEMTPTKDTNTPDSQSIGYETGHFPPNMWVQNVPFKVLQSLQFACADVKYFNHTASEVTKTGSWTDMYPNGADALRTAKTNTLGDSISLSFSGAKFAKFIVSNYGQYTATAAIKVTISENGGNYVTPASLNLVESHAFTNSGEYTLNDFAGQKFGQIILKGFDTSKSYVMKVELTNNQYLTAWGFETWTRERLNVVVSAEGGNVANNQLTHPMRFYNENIKPELCIMNLPFLNDLGTTKWNNYYKGSKEPSSAAISTPSQYDFIYCEESGTYTNFDGISAATGDYIEYDGTNWVLGSTKLNDMFSTYRSDLASLLKMCKKIGVPMLLMATHTSSAFDGKPFIPEGADLMKLIAKSSGLASIDVYQYQEDLELDNIWSDGTHLNDAGVQMYIDLISEVLSKNAEYIADGCAVVEYGTFTGHSNGGNTDFGFVVKNTPKVFISNPSVSIVSVSKAGFTVSGVGGYDYFVKP